MLAIKAGRAVDGEQQIPGGALVLADEGRIVGVEPATAPLLDSWAVVTFPHATVLPGLIDTHVHLGGDGRNGALDRLPGYRDDRIRVRQGDSGTAGMWLFQTGPKVDRAFIGMFNDNKVGLWGNTGAGWGFHMDTTTGNVGIGAQDPGFKLDVADRIRLRQGGREMMMDQLRQQLHDRLEILIRERELGEQRLHTVQRESVTLQQNLLCLSGAIQILHEVLEVDQPRSASADSHEPSDHDHLTSATSR